MRGELFCQVSWRSVTPSAQKVSGHRSPTSPRHLDGDWCDALRALCSSESIGCHRDIELAHPRSPPAAISSTRHHRTQSHLGIVISGLRISHRLERRIKRCIVQRQVIVLHRLLVDFIVRQCLTVWRPPHGIALIEFFAIYPTNVRIAISPFHLW